jgi:hypothetical protein
MGVSDRWVRQLLVKMKTNRDAVVIHGLRGLPSNRQIETEIRTKAIEILKSPDWQDFKPTFASEQLLSGHLRSRLAGRTRRRARGAPGTDDRRCHQPELGTVCEERRDAGEHGGAAGISDAVWPGGRLLHGPGFNVCRGPAAGGKARSNSAQRTG